MTCYRYYTLTIRRKLSCRPTSRLTTFLVSVSTPSPFLLRLVQTRLVFSFIRPSLRTRMNFFIRILIFVTASLRPPYFGRVMSIIYAWSYLSGKQKVLKIFHPPIWPVKALRDLKNRVKALLSNDTITNHNVELNWNTVQWSNERAFALSPRDLKI